MDHAPAEAPAPEPPTLPEEELRAYDEMLHRRAMLDAEVGYFYFPQYLLPLDAALWGSR